MKKVLYFYYPECIFCTLINKMVENNEFGDVQSVNVHDPENSEIVSKYGVYKVPEFIITDENEEVVKTIFPNGDINMQDLKNELLTQ